MRIMQKDITTVFNSTLPEMRCGRPAMVACGGVVHPHIAPIRCRNVGSSLLVSTAYRSEAVLLVLVLSLLASQAIEMPAPARSWRTGAYAMDTSSGEVLLDTRSTECFRPASTVKLVTTLLGLETLGPSHVYETRVMADTSSSTIYIVGTGAPLLETGEIERAAVETAAALDPGRRWAVICDTGCFVEETHPLGWEEADWGRTYCPPIEAVSIGDNVVEVVVSSAGSSVRLSKWPLLPGLEIEGRITVGGPDALSARPEGWDGSDNRIVVSGSMPDETSRRLFVPFPGSPAEFALMFAEVLASEGIEVSSVGCGSSPGGVALQDLSVVRSDRLSTIIADMNKWSMNGVAELVLRTSALAVSGEPASTAAGCELAGSMIRRLTPEAPDFQLADGSGLSRFNRLAPVHLATVIAAGATSVEWGPEFVASLAVNGSDGTLRSRLTDLPPGTFRGKTGTLNDTCTLAGLLVTSSGRSLAVAIMCEVPVGEVYSARNWQDSVVRELYASL
jgi:serine-type D-Ala-D-Ala carboxypeptidase/endopeptidase (penicillin-binding protein 4)